MIMAWTIVATLGLGFCVGFFFGGIALSESWKRDVKNDCVQCDGWIYRCMRIRRIDRGADYDGD